MLPEHIYLACSKQHRLAAYGLQPFNLKDNACSGLAAFEPGDAVVFEIERQGVVQYIAFEIE